ncbi:MAG: hypothetical protein OET79_11500 [Nitrospirota bacterium]|nr:hypothetical protein [Nitrospirota bacterium]
MCNVHRGPVSTATCGPRTVVRAARPCRRTPYATLARRESDRLRRLLLHVSDEHDDLAPFAIVRRTRPRARIAQGGPAVRPRAQAASGRTAPGRRQAPSQPTSSFVAIG